MPAVSLLPPHGHLRTWAGPGIAERVDNDDDDGAQKRRQFFSAPQNRQRWRPEQKTIQFATRACVYNLDMSLADLTRPAVLAAIDEHDRLGREEFLAFTDSGRRGITDCCSMVASRLESHRGSRASIHRARSSTPDRCRFQWWAQHGAARRGAASRAGVGCKPKMRATPSRNQEPETQATNSAGPCVVIARPCASTHLGLGHRQ